MQEAIVASSKGKKKIAMTSVESNVALVIAHYTVLLFVFLKQSPVMIWFPVRPCLNANLLMAVFIIKGLTFTSSH